MAFLIDTGVAVALERGDGSLEGLLARAGSDVPAIAAITASELLHGVHRADSALRRERRSHHVEALLRAVPVLPFDLEVARVHARVWADLAAQGQMIGAHDLIIAATALTHAIPVATRDHEHFGRIDGLELLAE